MHNSNCWDVFPLYNSIHFLLVFIQEAIDSSLCCSAQSFVELLLQEVLVLLQSPDSTEGDQLLKKHCLRAGRIVDFLLDILYYSAESAQIITLQHTSEISVSSQSTWAFRRSMSISTQPMPYIVMRHAKHYWFWIKMYWQFINKLEYVVN